MNAGNINSAVSKPVGRLMSDGREPVNKGVDYATALRNCLANHNVNPKLVPLIFLGVLGGESEWSKDCRLTSINLRNSKSEIMVSSIFALTDTNLAYRSTRAERWLRGCAASLTSGKRSSTSRGGLEACARFTRLSPARDGQAFQHRRSIDDQSVGTCGPSRGKLRLPFRGMVADPRLRSCLRRKG